jgi:insulysin
MKHANRTALALLLIPLLVALASCATAPPVPSTDGAYAPVQSPNDSRAYRLLTLDNGLKALLISDVDTPKAAASLDVHVGSGDNPEGRGGLAHFLEHMLFLGTENTRIPPSTSASSQSTEAHATPIPSFEHTNYFFDVDAQAPPRCAGPLRAVLHRTEIRCPLRRARAQRRGGGVPDGAQQRPRRGLDVLQATMNPDHPFSQFAVGSLEASPTGPDRRCVTS